MQTRGIDSFYSWVVAVSCGVMYLMISWPMRLGSILFVEMIDRYDTDRKGASLPFALATCMRSISSPLAGFFGEKFGLQRVTMLGCVFCTIGVGLCFFSEEIISIDIGLGLIYGCGFGWASCLVPEIINHHFAKHRAKGYSVVLGIAGMLNFLTPPLLEMILDEYGVSGTFLVMSAIILNSVLASMLLVTPETEETEDTSQEKECKSLKNIPDSNMDSEISTGKENVLESLLHHNKSNSYLYIKQPGISSTELGPLTNIPALQNQTKNLEQYQTGIESECNEDQNSNSVGNTKLATEVDLDLIESKVGELEGVFALDSIEGVANKSKLEVNLDSNESSYKTLTEEVSLDLVECRASKSNEDNLDSSETDGKKLTEADKYDLIESKHKLTKSKYNSFNILWSPMFLVMTFIQSSHFYVMYVSWTVTVDLVRDKNIAQHLEVYFVMALALLDTVGRSALGFVTDSGHMTVSNYTALCFGVMGLSCVLLVWVSGFPLTMTAICIFGFICGANTTVLPGVMTEFIDKEKRTMAMASRLLMYAPMSFTMSPLIGYFRGVKGSYDGLLYVMTGLCLSCSIILLLLPRFQARKQRT